MLLSGYFWHPLTNGPGYNFWSGPLADLGLVTIFTGLAFFVSAWWRKHNCHVHHCWRLQWHQHPGHGHPVCAKHHPYGQGRGDHLKVEHHTVGAHSEWPGLIAHPFDAASGNVHVSGFTTTAVGPVDVVVGDATAAEEPPDRRARRARVRKPGTGDVTELRPKDTA